LGDTKTVTFTANLETIHTAFFQPYFAHVGKNFANYL